MNPKIHHPGQKTMRQKLLPLPRIKVKNSKTIFFLSRLLGWEFHAPQHSARQNAAVPDSTYADVTRDRTARSWVAYRTCDATK